MSPWAVAAGIIYLAILYMLVRPSSTGPAAVTSVLDALTDLVRGATGYGNTGSNS